MSEGRRRDALFALAVAIVLAAAAWLRLDGAGAKALWYDEITSVLIADGRHVFEPYPVGVPVPKVPVEIGPRGGLDKVIDAKDDNHPPLYFLLLRFWKDLVGGGEGALRALSALFSLGTVVAGGLIGGLLGGRRAALAAMLLLALSPFEVYYAREARSYALLGLLTLASALALVRLEDESRPAGPRARTALWVLYAASIAAGLATHYIAVVAPAAHLAYFLARRRPASLERLPHALALAALLLTPIVGVTARHLWFTLRAPTGALSFATAPDVSAVQPQRSRAHVPEHAARLLAGLGTGTTLPDPALFLGGAIILGAAALGVRRRGAILGAAALATPALLIGLEVVFGGSRSAAVRYASISVGPLLTAAGVGLASLRAGVAAPAALAWIACASIGIAVERAAPAKGHDFRGAARILNESGCGEGDLVVLLLEWREQVIELNPHIAGAPSEMFVLDRLDRDAIEGRPWRDVYLIAVPRRRLAGDQLRAALGSVLPERGAWDLSGLLVVRYTRRPL